MLKSSTLLILLTFWSNSLYSQGIDDEITKIIIESSEEELIEALDLFIDLFPGHNSNTKPYLLENNSILFDEYNPCACTIVVDEYYKKIGSPDKRSLIYKFDFANLIITDEWVYDGVFNIELNPKNQASVDIFKGLLKEKSVNTKYVSFALPPEYDIEILIDAIKRISRICSNSEYKNILKQEQESSKTVDIFIIEPKLNNNNGNHISNSSRIPIRVKLISEKELDKSDISIVTNNKILENNSENSSFEEVINNGDNEYFYSTVVDLFEGKNKFECYVSGLSHKTFEITHAPNKPNLHLLSIGVNSADLKYTKQDAIDFANLFSNQQKGLFEKVNIDVIVDNSLTTSTLISRKIEDLRNLQLLNNELKPNDLIILFLSSHGFYDNKSMSYKIVTSEYDPLYVNSTTLDFEKDILETLEGINCKKIVFLDACYSGSVKEINNGSKSLAQNSMELSKSISDLISTLPDIYLFLSSSAIEKSYEDDSWKNGAFTEGIISGLTSTDQVNLNADLDNNGIVYLFELLEYLQAEVPNLIKEKNSDIELNQNLILLNVFSKEDIPIYFQNNK